MDPISNDVKYQRLLSNLLEGKISLFIKSSGDSTSLIPDCTPIFAGLKSATVVYLEKIDLPGITPLGLNRYMIQYSQIEKVCYDSEDGSFLRKSNKT